MDNSRSSQKPSSDQDFFTPGAGNASANQNDFEPENNLDLSSTANWSPDRNHRDIGSKAMFSPDRIQENMNILEADPNKLGEITDLEPSITPPQNINAATNQTLPAFDAKAISADGDRISKTTMREVKDIQNKFYQTGDAKDFYEGIRGESKDNPGVSGTYLKNVFNREAV